MGFWFPLYKCKKNSVQNDTKVGGGILKKYLQFKTD